MTRKFFDDSQQRHFILSTSSPVKKIFLQTITMPVLINKYNQLIEHYNIIRDHLNKPTIDLNELKHLQTRISQDENIYFITQDITSKLIYYIIETAYDELQYEKYEYLEKTLKNVTDIIRSGSYNLQEELKRLRTKCQTDNDSPYFDDLGFITTCMVTEAIKLLYATTRAGLHPHWVSSDEEEEDEHNQEPEEEVSEEDNEANNLDSLD